MGGSPEWSHHGTTRWCLARAIQCRRTLSSRRAVFMVILLGAHGEPAGFSRDLSLGIAGRQERGATPLGQPWLIQLEMSDARYRTRSPILIEPGMSPLSLRF